MDRLRRQLILGCAVGWAGPACAADVKELPLDSGSSGVLEPNRSSRLVVQTHLTGIRTTVWVHRDGRVNPDMGSLTQHLYENSYGWKTTALKSTDLWEISTEDLEEPTLAVLRVRGRDFLPDVALFIGVRSTRDLDPARGVRVPPSDDAATECLGLFVLDPKKRHVVTVQSQVDDDAAYRVSLVRASRFRR